MTDIMQLVDYVESHRQVIFPYRLMSEAQGLVRCYDLADVLAAVISQMIEGRTIVVMPPHVE